MTWPLMVSLGLSLSLNFFGGSLRLGLTGVWLSMALDECLRGIVSYRRWRTGHWRTTSALPPVVQVELSS